MLRKSGCWSRDSFIDIARLGIYPLFERIG
jgi:hypothetical protein